MTQTLDHPNPTLEPAADAGDDGPAVPTLWGLTPIQLHDRFWAARGVQVVRQGQDTELVPNAELFLLATARTMTVCRLAPLVDRLSWERPELLWLRLVDNHEGSYREYAMHDADGRLIGFERQYPASQTRMGRVVMTPERGLAELWQRAANPAQGWARLRRATSRRRRAVARLPGRVLNADDPRELMQCIRDLVRVWKQPDSTITRIQRAPASVWRDDTASVDPATSFVGPVWIGAGRRLDRDTRVVGPTVLWDDPAHRPEPAMLVWHEIEPGERLRQAREAAEPRPGLFGKRAFDIASALLALALTLPLYPLVMLAIWLEDGRPFFFTHRRQGKGGTTFPCIKFRSMRKDADHIKHQLAGANQVDGPQFYIASDPRLTRVGRLIRSLNIDELPQFINVLRGQMSLVGPRPSPDAENQYCPPWREARLSVRPGITGLWQVRRSREPELDFQEWIRYDIEYVENLSWRLDLQIIIETFRVLLRGT
ncbi:MAG: sugar transferase [Phycisphaeraceae bacterium]